MTTVNSIESVMLEATRALLHAGLPEPRRDAGMLLAHVLGRDRTFIITHADDPVDDDAIKRLADYLERRGKGEPVQYIIGHQQFFGLDFEVTPDVLIPRPETELLVEAAINLLNESVVSPLICDVGTGSGCIVIALLRVRHDAKALAIDISEAAIRVAHLNAHRLGVHERIDFIVSDGFSSLTPRTQGFDLVVSNPPYVSLSALQGLQREVRDYEPLVALKGGVDGLSIIRNLLKESSRYLKPGGCFLFEIGFDQGDAVREMVDMNVWDILDIHPDLQGIPRIVALRRERLKQP